MSCPAKPWEVHMQGDSCDKLCSSAPASNAPLSPTGPPVLNAQNDSRYSTPPPVPARNYTASFTNTPHGYSAYNRPAYSGFAPQPQLYPYGSYGAGSYGYGNSYMNSYNPYNMMNNPESRFIRYAEESTRPTFHAIESVVRAVNSISFMMESTYSALNMSFRAIVGVLENFSNLRSLFRNFILSLFALRTIKRFLNFICGILGIKYATGGEFKRAESVGTNPELPGTVSQQVSSLPFLAFIGVMIGAPYIISKLLPTEPPTSSAWNPATDSYVPMVAKFDFRAGTQEELSFTRGEQLKICPRKQSSPNWFLASNTNNNIGFVPRNYLTPIKDN